MNLFLCLKGNIRTRVDSVSHVMCPVINVKVQRVRTVSAAPTHSKNNFFNSYLAAEKTPVLVPSMGCCWRGF